MVVARRGSPAQRREQKREDCLAARPKNLCMRRVWCMRARRGFYLSPMLSISRLQTLLPGDLPHKKQHIHPLALITFSP
jgi:hypothetical protein